MKYRKQAAKVKLIALEEIGERSEENVPQWRRKWRSMAAKMASKAAKESA